MLYVLQVLEACRDVVQEMEEASRAGDKGRLQEALKEAVNWLSKNGSNPDVAANSAQVQCSLTCIRKKEKKNQVTPFSVITGASRPRGSSILTLITLSCLPHAEGAISARTCHMAAAGQPSTCLAIISGYIF